MERRLSKSLSVRFSKKLFDNIENRYVFTKANIESYFEKTRNKININKKG